MARPPHTAPAVVDDTARRLGGVVVVLAVALAHAGVLMSLEAPRDPSGRGQAVVSTALTVRHVELPHVEQPHVVLPHVVVPVARLDVTEAPLVARANDESAARPDALVKPTRAAVATSSVRSMPRATPAPAPQVLAAAVGSLPVAVVYAADTVEAEPASGAAEALLPDHLLRSLPTYAVRLPPSQRLLFRVSRGAARGEGVLDWSMDGGRYSAALRLRGEGMPGMDWTSEGDAASDAGVVPRRMVAHRKGRPIAAANFVVDSQKVSFSGASVERPFVRGGQDRLTWMLQLAGVLNAREAPLRDDERIVLYVVGPRGAADLWTWRVAGPQMLGMGAAATPAVKLVREAQRLYDTEIELWLDPAHHHLPLKWRQQQRGVERAPIEWDRLPG